MKLTITADLKAKGDLPKGFAKDLAKMVKEYLPEDVQAQAGDVEVKVSKVAVAIE